MRAKVKQLCHKLVRSFGFDVVRVGNIDSFIVHREQQRRDRYLEQIATLRQEHLTAPSRLGNAPPVVWVGCDALIPAAVRAMSDADVLLDIGCAFRPQKFLNAKVHICCEPFGDYLNRLMVETAGSSLVYLQATIEQACALFPPGSVDSVFLHDVIEHVDRDIAENCLKSLQQIARRQVIIFTPLGYMPQDHVPGCPDPWGMNGGEWQEHKSAWVPDDFPVSEGWQVVACRDYHKVDGYGRALVAPIGALWAIWTRQKV